MMDSLSKVRRRMASTFRRQPRKGFRSTTSEAVVEVPVQFTHSRSSTLRTALTNPENIISTLNASEVGMVNEIRTREKLVEKQRMENDRLRDQNSKLSQELQTCGCELSNMRSRYERAVEEITHLSKERDNMRRLLWQMKREKESQVSELKKQCSSLQQKLNRFGCLLPGGEASSSFPSIPYAHGLTSSVSASALTWEVSETITEGSEQDTESSVESSNSLATAVERRLGTLDQQRLGVLREANHSIATTVEIGNLFSKKGDFRLGARFYVLAADLKQKFVGSSTHPELFALTETLANALAKSGQWNRVEEYSKRLLKFPQCRDNMERRIQVMLKLKARALQNQGKREEHESLLLELLKLCGETRSEGGALIPLSASVRCALGTIYMQKKDFPRASMYVEEAMEICSNNLPPTSPVIQSVAKVHQAITATREKTESEMCQSSGCDDDGVSATTCLPKSFVLAPAPLGKNRRSSQQ